MVSCKSSSGISAEDVVAGFVRMLRYCTESFSLPSEAEPGLVAHSASDRFTASKAF
jgi:hypothetical protein